MLFSLQYMTYNRYILSDFLWLFSLVMQQEHLAGFQVSVCCSQ